MIFFKVTENINIKITDGTLVKFLKPKKTSDVPLENIYCTTYDDVDSIRKIFQKIGAKYKLEIVSERSITTQKDFPREIGVLNTNEYELQKQYKRIKEEKADFIPEEVASDIQTLFSNEKPQNLQKQVATFKKGIKIAIVGGVGRNIGEMICGLNAVRILYETLKKEFKSVKIDLMYISSDNKYYTRDKDIAKNEPYINKVLPLAVSVKKMCEYDFYIDNSLIAETSFYQELPFIDAYLYKFAIDYKSIPSSKKHNQLNLSLYKPNEELVEQLNKLKQKGKILLFHPYSANIERSIPKDIAVKLLEKLIKKAHDYTIISAIKFDNFKDDNFVDLSNRSKSFFDFAYIISRADSIISCDTATYHIADIFFIPTVVIFSTVDPQKRIKYYTCTKAVEIDNSKFKNFSQFIFDKDSLVLYKFNGWENIKIKKILKLLQPELSNRDSRISTTS